MKATRLLSLSLLFLFFLSCNSRQQKGSAKVFDPAGWRRQVNNQYPERKAMLPDVMRQELHGLSRDSLIRLLGAPDKSKEGYLYYKISEEKIGFWPLHVQTLVIHLNADSTVAWRKIHG